MRRILPIREIRSSFLLEPIERNSKSTFQIGPAEGGINPVKGKYWILLFQPAKRTGR
jgi:hypothetical protein